MAPYEDADIPMYEDSTVLIYESPCQPSLGKIFDYFRTSATSKLIQHFTGDFEAKLEADESFERESDFTQERSTKQLGTLYADHVMGALFSLITNGEGYVDDTTKGLMLPLPFPKAEQENEGENDLEADSLIEILRVLRQAYVLFPQHRGVWADKSCPWGPDLHGRMEERVVPNAKKWQSTMSEVKALCLEWYGDKQTFNDRVQFRLEVVNDPELLQCTAEIVSRGETEFRTGVLSSKHVLFDIMLAADCLLAEVCNWERVACNCVPEKVVLYGGGGDDAAEESRPAPQAAEVRKGRKRSSLGLRKWLRGLRGVSIGTQRQ